MINICYSGNKRIFEGLLMATMSITRNCEDAVHLYVLTMDLHEENPNFLPFSDDQIKLLEDVLKEKNPESCATKVDVTDFYIKTLRDGKNHHNGYTPYATLRLLLDMVPNMPDKMIYLDIDTMCYNSIKELWDIDISDYDCAIVKDYMGRFWIRYNYFNSGVMLMNLKRIRENGLFEKCRQMVNKKKMIMPDQSALNKYAKRKYLPFKFNEQRKIKPDTVVKHFCKGIVFFLPFGFHIYNIKQWNREKVHKSLKIFCYDDIYERVDKLKTTCPNCF